jgi:protein PhnA
MPLSEVLSKRAAAKCELCTAETSLSTFSLIENTSIETEQIAVCEHCTNQLSKTSTQDADYWRCLNSTMWTEYLPVKVAIWSILTHHKSAVWPVELLDMMYLSEEETTFAKRVLNHLYPNESTDDAVVHKDANGAVLQAGDTVVITKDLDVKGASLTAKRGTAVRNISLVYDNAEQIEGRVDGQHIVILTKFVKKTK